MLRKISKARHIGVGVVVSGMATLGFTGVLGGGEERFDAKTVVVTPTKTGEINITEYVDQDFASNRRRGYQRKVVNDFGVPTNVSASSPDAPDKLWVIPDGEFTILRIGVPDITISGQHRYRLSYTLPDPKFDQLGLALDIVSAKGEFVGAGDNETGRFEVVVTGVELDNPRCQTGEYRSTNPCQFVEDNGVYRAVIEPLPKGHGLTIRGDITGFTTPATIDAPPIPERRNGNGLVGAGMGIAGLLGALPIFRWARRRGANQVFGTGAADAAMGKLDDANMPTRLVTDAELHEMAAIEFVPPKGVQPWEASVALSESHTPADVAAWLSDLAVQGAIILDEEGKRLKISYGPNLDKLNEKDRSLITNLLPTNPYVTGEYGKSFAEGWQDIFEHQKSVLKHRSWWRHGGPGGGVPPTAFLLFFAPFILAAVFFGSAAFGFPRHLPVVAVVLAALASMVMALFMYATLLPSRTAQGSAVALQAESFRRFLDASEGRHVEWAWEHGLLREYSGWAVALGAAGAWAKALEQANVPPAALQAADPMLVDTYRVSLGSTYTEPSSSSSGGSSFGSGGSFGGGGVGGGGGGGSSGSW